MIENVSEQLIELINKNSKAAGASICDNTNLMSDLGFDSIDIMRLIMEIEGKFNISFDFEDLDYERLVCIGNLCSVIKDKL